LIRLSNQRISRNPRRRRIGGEFLLQTFRKERGGEGNIKKRGRRPRRGKKRGGGGKKTIELKEENP